MSEQHLSPETLLDFLHGELPEGEDAAVHAHLAECRECSAAYDSEASLTEVIREHYHAQERELPQGVVLRIRDAVAASHVPWWRRLTASLRPLTVGTAIAAGLLFGTFLSLRTWHSHAQASTIDAAYYLDDHSSLAPTTPFGEGAALPQSLSNGTTETEEHPAADETH
jgi:anti-sigma factor RsiW